jgi:hypothetical protein
MEEIGQSATLKPSNQRKFFALRLNQGANKAENRLTDWLNRIC